MDLLRKIGKLADFKESDLLRELSMGELEKLDQTAPCCRKHFMCNVVHKVLAASVRRQSLSPYNKVTIFVIIIYIRL